jgi:cytochrome c oxidase assembly factor CtaG
MPLAQADTSWTLQPGAIGLVVLLAVLYLPRWRRVRGADGARAAPTWRLLAFVAGLLTLVAALLSPIDALGEQAFVMHMLQHVLLLDVAPILLVAGLTKVILRPATRRLHALERAAGLLWHPATAVALYVGLMWVWHVPALYDAALRSTLVHVVEHVTFFSIGALYWWHLLSPVRSRWLSSRGMGPVVYMLSTKVLVGLLGIAITFAPGALYGFYEERPPIWGLNAEEDQALAGGLMALEQSLVMGIALAYLFIRALAESDRDDERAERLAEREADLAERA